MKTINILHVASFKGNIGDNINHLGFYRQLEASIGYFEIEKFEIRETFWGNAFFDDNFVRLCNTKDLVIIGGGNYFELWVSKSKTGCSIDISPEKLNNIRTPVVFNSLGVDPGQGVLTENKKKFERFLKSIIENDHMILSVRNDGAIQNIKKYIGQEYVCNFHNIIDAGFYFKRKGKISKFPEIDSNRKNILFQVAGDMLDVRFDEASEINKTEFIHELASVIEKITPRFNVLLCAHIYKDMQIINEIISSLRDKTVRNDITILPLIQGDAGAEYIAGIYNCTDLNVPMRFHANVISLISNSRTIGMVNYVQIENLYSELELSSSTIDVRLKNFSERLIHLINEKLSTKNYENRLIEGYLNRKRKDYVNYMNNIKEVLST